jgi:hypothetical protein
MKKIKQWGMALPFRRQLFRACLLALVIISMICIWRAVLSFEDANSIYVSLSMKSPQKGVAELFYDTGKGFNVTQVVSASIRGDGQIYDYLFKLPNKTIYNLRWDPPLVRDNVISIQKMGILDGSRRPVKRLSLRQLEPFQQIAALTISDEKADIRVQEEANDPQLRIRLESPLFLKNYYSLFLLAGKTFLEFLGLFLVSCLLIYVGLSGRDKVIATVIIISLVLFGWRCWILYDDATSLFLKVTMSSTVSSTAQVYYDMGQGLNEKHSLQMDVVRQEGPQRYRFKLPNALMHELRFDPLMTSGSVRIGEIKLTNAFDKVIREIDLRQIKPLKQIKSFQFVDNVLDVSTADDANDPQLVVDVNGYLNYQTKMPFPFKEWLLKLMMEAVLFFLFAFVFVLVWKKWGDVFLEGLDSPFIQEKLPLIYLGTASGLILAMGFVSGLDVHPDEWNGHIKAAAYYILNWIPPAVDDPRVANSISVFGISYLWHIDPLYFLAVKATQVLSGIVSDFYLRLRLFNAFLFLSFVLVIAVQIKRSRWMVPFLVITPQVWYVFSYFNNDAFPWLIAMLLAMQFIDPESSLNRFLSAPTFGHKVGGGVLAGILLGLLLSSKLNYRVYIAFLIFAGLWAILFEVSSQERMPRLKKWTFIGLVALLFYLPLYGYDQYINDFKKDEKVFSIMENRAVYQFKLSTLKNDLSSSYKGLHMKEKGMSFRELFIQNSDWRDMSFNSFFGVYGYMDLVSDKDYYLAVTYVLGFLSLLVFFYAAVTLPVRDVFFLLFVILFAGLVVGQSVYHSWINDYQPQGRYLFPILPMCLVGLARLPASFRTRIMPLFGLVFFILSVWSFLMTGLKTIPKIN